MLEERPGIWILETRLMPAALLFRDLPPVAFVRGYFDAEGGIPQNRTARFYIQITQKNHDDLVRVATALAGLQIACGIVHNPSIRVDPDYWRFYVRSASHSRFIDVVSSWHPRKRRLLMERSGRDALPQ